MWSCGHSDVAAASITGHY